MIQVVRGDCLQALHHVSDGSVDMVFADLPYGVTANKWDTVIPFEPLWAQLLRVGKRNAAFVFTATQPFATSLICSQRKLFRYDLIFEKGRPTGFLSAKRMPLRAHEHVLVFAKATPRYNPLMTAGGRPYNNPRNTGQSNNYGKAHRVAASNPHGINYPRSVVRLASVKGQASVHPTQKPVALLEWLIKTYSNPGDTILDPTMGSGTTGVACVNTARRFFGVELDRTYYRTAKKRILAAMKAKTA